ncbi:MAG: hydroxysqualene dehydroxylase HpnE [Gammaproteobacteria bacterium]|nr:hydroxysqualene dehydroxylase HpnE [Gammaproteobacteria bacterium]
MKVAIVGTGWAGLACAIEATRAGHAVTLFEATRHAGGRARALAVELPDGGHATLDNGQHILIGAYSATLALMRDVGVDPETALLRLPLTLRFADGGGLQVPKAPPPLDLLAGIVGARGWTWRDKWALLRTTVGWRINGFACAPTENVEGLCAALTPRVMDELIRPLCLSALNTPADAASAQVFLRVLHDALFSERGGADLLLPRVDLGALFPDAALAWLAERGARTCFGVRIASLTWPASPGSAVDAVPLTSTGSADVDWHVAGERFEQVVLAVPPWDAARLCARIGRADAAAWAQITASLGHEGIATVYAQGDVTLPAPLLALRSGPGAPAQFVFDRGQLGGPRGLLAFVVSASADERESVERDVLQQAAQQLGMRHLRPVQTVVERRATFACTANLQRPGMQVAPGLLACGDYVAGPYPSTIEGAVRSGLAAARSLANTP